MRYLVAIVLGAFFAVLPLLIIATPELAWWNSCMSAAQTIVAPQDFRGLVEDPCGISHRGPDQPVWMSVLNSGIVAINCVIAGALSARIAGERRMAAAFLAPFL